MTLAEGEGSFPSPGGRARAGRFNRGNTLSAKGGRARAKKIAAVEQLERLTSGLEPPSDAASEWQAPFEEVAKLELQELLQEVAVSRGMKISQIPHTDLRLSRILSNLIKAYEMCVHEADRAPNVQAATEWHEKGLLFMRPAIDLLRKLRLDKTKEEAKRLKRVPIVNAAAIPARSALGGLPTGGHMPPPPIPPVRQGK